MIAPRAAITVQQGMAKLPPLHCVFGDVFHPQAEYRAGPPRRPPRSCAQNAVDRRAAWVPAFVRQGAKEMGEEHAPSQTMAASK